MAINAAQVYRDYVVQGVPSSGPHKPSKPDIRTLLTGYEKLLGFGSTGAGSVAKATRSDLYADLSIGANIMAWVYADPTVEYNAIYRKIGASGTGSWEMILPLPYSFIVAVNDGTGTPNVIHAVTEIPVSDASLIILGITADNTDSPVTVSFNDGEPLPIKSNTGNDIATGGLVAGMQVLGVATSTEFRIVTDQVSTAIIAQAEAAAADAETWKDLAASYAASVNLPSIVATDAFKILTPKVDGSGHQIYASYRETMRRLKQSAVRGRVIWAGHNNIYAGASGVSGGTTAAGRTFVHSAVTRNIKQDGLIRRVSFHVSANGGDAANNFKLLILRPNGATFDVIDTSDAILIGAGTGLKQVELPRPIGPARMGDKLGIWISGGVSAASWTLAANAGQSSLFTAGLAVGGETYTSGANSDLCLFGMGSSPVIVAHGDSLFCHNGGSGHEWFTGPDGNGPTGERDSDPIYQAINRSGLNIFGLDYQNNSKGSTTWADTATLISGWTFGTAAENKLAPKIVIIVCGLNDLISYSKTWAQVEKDMYTCLSLLSGVDRLFICEMPPYLGSTDAQAATIRDWNSKYATWCANNGAVLIPLHDAMGQLRASTGFLDDPKYVVGGGDPHWSKTGVDIAGSIIAQAVLGTLV